MRKRGMQLGKKVVVALSCVVIGLGSVMLVEAQEGTKCPECMRNTVHVYKTQVLVTDTVKCTRRDHVPECLIDYVYRETYQNTKCTNPDCSYSYESNYPIERVTLSEHHYGVVR